MVKRSRSRSHTKRRKSRRGGVRTWSGFFTGEPADPAPTTVAEQIAPAASVPLDAAAAAAPPVADAMTPPGLAPEDPGMTRTGGRSRRRRGSRKTKRRRGGKYY